tara:strand:+ start:1540 stop:2439 length:900 start_codon:yes stop_codon:yes gene_type:complete
MPNTLLNTTAKPIAKPIVISIAVALAATAGYFYYQQFIVDNKALAEVATKPTILKPVKPPTVASTISIDDIFDDTSNTGDTSSNSQQLITEMPEPLPPLDNSDGNIQAKLETLLADEVFREKSSLMFNNELMRKMVLGINNLGRGEISYKYPPATINIESFERFVTAAPPQQDAPRYLMGEATFSRYNQAIAVFSAIDKAALAKFYRWSQPLWQQAYNELGNAEVEFNKVTITALDRLLSAPDIEGDIVLTRPSVMFKYADPNLEKRSDSDKLMLRLGPDNRRILKAALRDFKKELNNN